MRPERWATETDRPLAAGWTQKVAEAGAKMALASAKLAVVRRKFSILDLVVDPTNGIGSCSNCTSPFSDVGGNA
jgi:hypothetical protein